MSNSDSSPNKSHFVPWCECDECVARIRKPMLFANIISSGSGDDRRHKIDTASPDHQHLREMVFTDPFEALRLIDDNGLTFIAWVG
jgi:hypothetical protein